MTDSTWSLTSVSATRLICMEVPSAKAPSGASTATVSVTFPCSSRSCSRNDCAGMAMGSSSGEGASDEPEPSPSITSGFWGCSDSSLGLIASAELEVSGSEDSFELVFSESVEPLSSASSEGSESSPASAAPSEPSSSSEEGDGSWVLDCSSSGSFGLLSELSVTLTTLLCLAAFARCDPLPDGSVACVSM